MPELDIAGLQKHLLRAGVAPRHVRRTVAELTDHYEDLLQHEMREDPGGARDRALQTLGDLRDIATAVRAQPELRVWAQRMPYLALVVYPLTCLTLLPALPLIAGAAHAAYLARWLTCIVLSGLVTAGIFLILQHSIALT